MKHDVILNIKKLNLICLLFFGKIFAELKNHVNTEARKLGKSKNSKYSRCRLKRAAFHDVITNIVIFSL